MGAALLVACNWDDPRQAIVLGVADAEMLGEGSTPRLIDAEPVHPSEVRVPVTTYVVVAEGVAVTGLPVVALKPVAGAHE